MPAGSRRVTRAEWYALGGLRNPSCWRRQDRHGRWLYYVTQS